MKLTLFIWLVVLQISAVEMFGFGRPPFGPPGNSSAPGNSSMPGHGPPPFGHFPHGPHGGPHGPHQGPHGPHGPHSPPPSNSSDSVSVAKRSPGGQPGGPRGHGPPHRHGPRGPHGPPNGGNSSSNGSAVPPPPQDAPDSVSVSKRSLFGFLPSIFGGGAPGNSSSGNHSHGHHGHRHGHRHHGRHGPPASSNSSESASDSERAKRAPSFQIPPGILNMVNMMRPPQFGRNGSAAGNSSAGAGGGGRYQPLVKFAVKRSPKGKGRKDPNNLIYKRSPPQILPVFPRPQGNSSGLKPPGGPGRNISSGVGGPIIHMIQALINNQQ